MSFIIQVDCIVLSTMRICPNVNRMSRIHPYFSAITELWWFVIFIIITYSYFLFSKQNIFSRKNCMVCYSNGFVCLQYIQYTRHNIVWWQKMMRLRKQKIIGRYHLFSNTHNDDKRAFCICWGCPFLTFVKYFINEDIFLASILLLYLLFDNNHFL